MARRKSDPFTGDAGEDGFTVLSKRPRSAAPGNMVPIDVADTYDEMTDFLVEVGGRNAARRRVRDLNDDGSDY